MRCRYCTDPTPATFTVRAVGLRVTAWAPVCIPHAVEACELAGASIRIELVPIQGPALGLELLGTQKGGRDQALGGAGR